MRNSRACCRGPACAASHFVFLAALLLGAAHGLPANVTLSTITLRKKFSWFTTPKIFFHCDGRNETLVLVAPVKAVHTTYNLTGKEEWQPITTLEPQECRNCEVYDSTWFGKGSLSLWSICSENFTVSDNGTYAHMEQGLVELDLYCPACEGKDFRSASGTEAGGGAEAEVGPLFWIAVGIAFVGLLLLVAGALVYNNDDVAEEEEKQQLVEMEDHPAGEGEGMELRDLEGRPGEDLGEEKKMVHTDNSKL